MALGTFQDNLRKGWLSQFQMAPGFNPDNAFGANMVSRSNEQNPNPLRDVLNGLIGAREGGNTGSVFSDLFDPEKMGTIGSSLASTGASMGLNMGGQALGRLIGGNTGANVGNAVGSVGGAALQGFANPIADLQAGASLAKLIGGFF